MSKCLVCFEEGAQDDYHPRCSQRLFGSKSPLVIDLKLADLPTEGLKLLQAKGGIAGVQKKLSLGRSTTEPRRLTVVGFQGNFILKPPSEDYPALPENEALCMELAHQLGLKVAGHGLVRLASGELAYLSRRFDRPSEGSSWHQEDFCQLAERPSADKYKGSLEAAGKLLKYSRQTGFDALRFWELNVFCWLTGNADMHLKNFSLLHDPDHGWSFSPAYDLVSTKLVIADDKEETALAVNGKKAGLHRRDWWTLADHLGIEHRVATRLAMQLADQKDIVNTLTKRSFLPADLQERFLALYSDRSDRLLSGNPGA